MIQEPEGNYAALLDPESDSFPLIGKEEGAICFHEAKSPLIRGVSGIQRPCQAIPPWGKDPAPQTTICHKIEDMMGLASEEFGCVVNGQIVGVECYGCVTSFGSLP